MKLLSPNSWESNYALSFDVYRERSESAYLCGKFDEAEKGFNLLMEKARTKLEQGIIYNLRIIQNENLSRSPKPQLWAAKAVALFDIHFPDSEEEKLALVDQEIGAIQERLAGKEVADLVNLPVMRGSRRKDLHETADDHVGAQLYFGRYSNDHVDCG